MPLSTPSLRLIPPDVRPSLLVRPAKLFALVLLRVLLARRNKLRDEAHGVAEATMNTEDAILDLTDFAVRHTQHSKLRSLDSLEAKNRNFRYLL